MQLKDSSDKIRLVGQGQKETKGLRASHINVNHGRNFQGVAALPVNDSGQGKKNGGDLEQYHTQCVEEGMTVLGTHVDKSVGALLKGRMILDLILVGLASHSFRQGCYFCVR